MLHGPQLQRLSFELSYLALYKQIVVRSKFKMLGTLCGTSKIGKIKREFFFHSGLNNVFFEKCKKMRYC